MTSHAADTILGLTLTGLLTLSSLLNPSTTGWRSWVPALAMLAAFVPLRRPLPAAAAHPALLIVAFVLWTAIVLLRPIPNRPLRQAVVAGCGLLIGIIQVL